LSGSPERFDLIVVGAGNGVEQMRAAASPTSTSSNLESVGSRVDRVPNRLLRSRAWANFAKGAVKTAILLGFVFLAACDRGEVSGLPIDAFDPEIAVACQAGCSAPITEIASEGVADQPGAAVGELVSCPVSGVVFRVHEASSAVEHAGQQYFTCCGGCAEKLRGELAALGTEGPSDGRRAK